MRIIQRRRHERRRFSAGITEHDALIACAFVFVTSGIDALGDVYGLLVKVNFNLCIFPVKAFLFVPDILHSIAGNAFNHFLGD